MPRHPVLNPHPHLGMAQRVEGATCLRQLEAQPVLPTNSTPSHGMCWSRRVTWFWGQSGVSGTRILSPGWFFWMTHCAIMEAQGTHNHSLGTTPQPSLQRLQKSCSLRWFIHTCTRSGPNHHAGLLPLCLGALQLSEAPQPGKI